MAIPDGRTICNSLLLYRKNERNTMNTSDAKQRERMKRLRRELEKARAIHRSSERDR